MNNRQVYLDYASATPIDPKVLKSILPYLSNNYGNPSSLHKLGRINKEAIKESRVRISEHLGVNPEEIIFTSGGTESDNLAILGIARANKKNGKHIIVSGIEHKAILNACKKLENEGFSLTYLDVNKSGMVSINHLKKSLRQDTILISIIYANNEIGVIQPIKKISNIIKKYNPNIIFHTDACQAAGSVSLDVGGLGVDSLTLSASKIYGPKGIGCLYVNKRCLIEPIIFGGDQENGIRSGTENVASIVGFSHAMNISLSKMKLENKRIIKMRNYFLSRLQNKNKDILLNGDIENRLPNNLNISVSGVEGESLVLLLDNSGIYCSTNSACSSEDLNPSHVLINIGVPIALAHCSVRFTLGRYTNKRDLDYAINIISKSIKKIRGISTIKINEK